MKERTMPQDKLWWNINYSIHEVCRYINDGYIVQGEENTFLRIAHNDLQKLEGMADILFHCQLITKSERDEVWELVQELDWELDHYVMGMDLYIEEEDAA